MLTCIATVALGQAICLAVAISSDQAEIDAFATALAISLSCCLLTYTASRKATRRAMRPKDGYLAVSLGWIVAIGLAAIPFLFTSYPQSPIEALFEATSGLTTTGATAFSGVDQMPKAILLWRSLMQWLGGIGIVVLLVVVAPITGLASNKIFNTEAGQVVNERMTPRIASTARAIIAIYMALSLIGFLSYTIAGMSPWEALNHIMTTVSTGGFSTHDSSIAYFNSQAIEWTVIAFMLLGGINFAFYWQAVRGKSVARQWPEIKGYLLIGLAASIAVVAILLLLDKMGGQAIRHGVFSTISLLTGTGYVNSDFDQWASSAQIILLGLMFIGGCAGSTTGGLRVIRVLLLAKSAKQEIEHQLNPQKIQVLRIGQRIYQDGTAKAVTGFATLWIIVTAAGALALSLCGYDLISSISGSAATLNIVGPALGEFGASENLSGAPDGAMIVFIILMLLGRLELFTLLVLLSRAFWRKTGS